MTQRRRRGGGAGGGRYKEDVRAYPGGLPYDPMALYGGTPPKQIAVRSRYPRRCKAEQ